MDTTASRSPLATLAGIVPALLLAVLAVGACPVAAATSYGPNAPIPFLLLPADNPVNTPVDDLPLDPNSADYIAHMSPGTGLHPDFGTRWQGAAIGIPYTVVPGTQPLVPIHFTEYGSESDPGPYPIPPDAAVEGVGGPLADGDRHVLVLDADRQMLYELYHASRQPDGSWNAGSGAVFDLTSNGLRPAGWTSADAAGLPMLPYLARYDEVVGEGVLDHAVRFTMAETQRAYVYPATHFASDNDDPDLPPMGLRVRLKAGFDIGGFSPEVQVILLGLKKYGMVVADNGGDWYVGGSPDPRWNDETLHALEEVKGSDFEVVDTRALQPQHLAVSLPATDVVAEGTPWTQDGSFVDESGSSWTGAADFGAGAKPLDLRADKTFTLAHTWADEGVFTARATVTDDHLRAASASVIVTVLNVAPRVRAGGRAKVASGALFTRSGSFADPGAERWTGSVTWGDGSARQALRLRADKTFVLSHRFPRARGRSYVVAATVRDDDDSAGTARFTVAVR